MKFQNSGYVENKLTEKMIAYLEEKEWDHMILYQDNKKKELFNNLNTLGLSHKMKLPSKEREYYATYVTNTKISLEVHDQ